MELADVESEIETMAPSVGFAHMKEPLVIL